MSDTFYTASAPSAGDGRAPRTLGSSIRTGGLPAISRSITSYAVVAAIVALGAFSARDALTADAVQPTAATTHSNRLASTPAPVLLTVVAPDKAPGQVRTRTAPDVRARVAQRSELLAHQHSAETAAAAILKARSLPRRTATPTKSTVGSALVFFKRRQSVQVQRASGPKQQAHIEKSATASRTVQPSAAYQVVATQGAIVYIGDDGRLVANTGPTSSSGMVALGADGSSLTSGASRTAPQRTSSAKDVSDPHANSTFVSLTGNGQGRSRSTAISGFEDHSVSVVGDDQVVTYDDSNVFLNRDGSINANTGDTDSSGLNATDVTDSRVRAGNSGDGEGDGESEDEEDEEVDQVPATNSGLPETGTDIDEDADSDDEAGHGQADDEEAGEDESASTDSGPGSMPNRTAASVSDEGASTADGINPLVVGADGYDDVSIRTQGRGDIVSYDDSNVVIGGRGHVNAQIGDSDTGGAVAMGIRNSDVEAGCEGDLCSTR